MREAYSLYASVVVPLAQATVSGLLIGIAIGTIKQSWETFWVTMTVTWAVAWVLGYLRWTSLAAPMTRIHEPVELHQPAARLRVEVLETDQGRYKGTFLDLNISEDKFADLARGLLAGCAFSESQWTGRGRPFSRRQFRVLRDEFVRRGLVQWRREDAHAQGLELTRTGNACMRYLCDSPALVEGVYSDE